MHFDESCILLLIDQFPSFLGASKAIQLFISGSLSCCPLIDAPILHPGVAPRFLFGALLLRLHLRLARLSTASAIHFGANNA
jgi:hypothetical protein